MHISSMDNIITLLNNTVDQNTLNTIFDKIADYDYFKLEDIQSIFTLISRIKDVTGVYIINANLLFTIFDFTQENYVKTNMMKNGLGYAIEAIISNLVNNLSIIPLDILQQYKEEMDKFASKYSEYSYHADVITLIYFLKNKQYNDIINQVDNLVYTIDDKLRKIFIILFGISAAKELHDNDKVTDYLNQIASL